MRNRLRAWMSSEIFNVDKIDDVISIFSAKTRGHNIY